MHYPTLKLTQQPNWFDAKQIWRYREVEKWRDWLVCEGSLTKRLRKQGKVRVEKLRQCWAYPSVEEAQYLGVPINQRVMLREVLIHCEGQFKIFARSLFPAPLLAISGKCLQGLGNRSLGDMVFSRYDVRREQLQVAKIPPQGYYQQRITACAGETGDNTWARRSRIYFHQYPMLVTEVFIDG